MSPLTDLTSEERELLDAARDASRRAHCPYSGFHVGAAIRAGGRTYLGANIENASYGLTVCAERTAAFAAVLDGVDSFEMIAVCCADAQTSDGPATRMPCGACRQVLAEFASDNSIVIVDGVGRFRLEELLPTPFRLRA